MRSPTRRAALAVCVALLLVIAGCNGATTPNSTATTSTTDTGTTATTSTTTTATTATTTTGTWSPNAPTELYPPGVAANGTLTNVSTIVDAHFEATANKSMALTHKWTTANESHVHRYAHGANQTPYYSTITHEEDGSRVVKEYYRTDSHGYLRTAAGNRTGYDVLQNSTLTVDSTLVRGSPFGPRHTLWTLLNGGNYSVNGTVERNGQTFVQLTADEPSPPGKDMDITAYEGTVLVTPDGVIYNADESFVQERDGTTEPVESSITLDTDVAWSGAPSWVATLPHLSISIVEDGHALEIRNRGGAVLPANTTFDVDGANEGTVTTNERLEPGDAFYVTAGTGGNSSSFALHAERTRGAYTFEYTRVSGTHETVYYRLVTDRRFN